MPACPLPPPAFLPSARRAPTRAARGGAESRPWDQLWAVGSRRKGPAREGRRRLEEVRGAAQGETAEGPAERGHGCRLEQTTTATPTVRAPRSGSRRHSDCQEASASEPAATPLRPHVTPSRTLHPEPPKGMPGFVVWRAAAARDAGSCGPYRLQTAWVPRD